MAKKNVADKKKVYYANIINNIALILSGILFCINILINVFIQMEATNLVNKTSIQEDKIGQDDISWLIEILKSLCKASLLIK